MKRTTLVMQPGPIRTRSICYTLVWVFQPKSACWHPIYVWSAEAIRSRVLHVCSNSLGEGGNRLNRGHRFRECPPAMTARAFVSTNGD
jgi:hypothetical protein